ncbi:hypothetical protein [Prosthecomicrobium sp. N25]|uniref:hypothetical protein n=1 Tax=Prosthecomicrobium sp. N25 TaxID=3129254 RepID=UPI003076A877
MIEALLPARAHAPEDRRGPPVSSFDIDDRCRACARRLRPRGARHIRREADLRARRGGTPADDPWFIRFLVPIVTLCFWMVVAVLMV